MHHPLNATLNRCFKALTAALPLILVLTETASSGGSFSTALKVLDAWSG